MEERQALSLKKSHLIAISAGAFVLGSAIFVFFVMPAEFGRDPTGFGRSSGLQQLAGPQVVSVAETPAGSGETARYYETGFRSDTIEIPLPAEDGDLEYKVKMKPGATLTYAWEVTGDPEHPDWFYYDFHGESRPTPPGERPTVIEYKQMTGISLKGALVAPFEGIHGWYFQNQSDKPVVVHLKISGFYELIPPGEYGNEGKIEPVKP